MKSAGKARSNGLYRHIRTSKEIIRNLLNDSAELFILLLLLPLFYQVIFSPRYNRPLTTSVLLRAAS